VLRASGGASWRWGGRPRRRLPESLRDRLLAIPETDPQCRTRLTSASAVEHPRSSWFLASPFAPIAASFLVAVGVSLFFGNPYEAGATTVAEMRGEMAPTAVRLREGATWLAGAASDFGEAAVSVLPRAGRSASRAITRTLQQHVGGDDAASTRH
jgi:hypothetical protein